MHIDIVYLEKETAWYLNTHKYILSLERNVFTIQLLNNTNYDDIFSLIQKRYALIADIIKQQIFLNVLF